MSKGPAAPGDLEGEGTAEYSSLEDVERGLARLERDFRERRDRRAIFATAYLVITRALQRRLSEGGFQDGEWVTRYAVRFGNMYRAALVDFERGDAAAVPKAWRLAFEAAAGGTGLVLQDLLLGVNAHINHDLALALDAATIDPDREGRYVDHTVVNEVLRATTDALQARIGELYAPLLGVLDLAGGALDEALGNFATSKAREHAWVGAVALANARDERERLGVRQGLDSQAAVLGKLILAPSLGHPWLPGALHHLEARTPWWTHLTVPDTERRLAEDTQMRGGPPATAEPSPGRPRGALPGPAGRRR